MLLLINANRYQIKAKHLAFRNASPRASQVIHSLYGNMVDEFVMLCPDLENYYTLERNRLLLLSLLMNRFAKHPLLIGEGGLAGRNRDRGCEH